MRVDIYTTPTCGYCHQAKQFFSDRGVKYFEYDVSRDADARERMVNLTGQMGVPVIVIDGRVVIGFDRLRIEKLLNGTGNGHRARIGLKVGDATKYTQQPGAYVGVVESNSPSEQAGLRKGDIIVSVDSNRVNTAMDLQKIISTHISDDPVTIVFIRDNHAMQVQLAK